MRAFLLALALPLACWAAEPPFKAEIVVAGVFETVGETMEKPAPGTAAGKQSEHTGARLVARTNQLRAARGATFGFIYRLSGVPDGLLAGFSLRVLHPPMRGPDGSVKTVSTAPTELLGEGGEAYGDILYTLAEPFEVLRGKWELQILYHGKPVVSQVFTLQ